MPQRLHSIYGLVDPETGEMRYVGKSKNPKARLGVHLCYARQGKCTHAFRWIKGLIDRGTTPGLVILENNITEECIDERERWWISEGIKRGWRLTNMTEGGDGGHPKYPETSQKLSQANKGKPKPPRSEEHRRKLSEAIRGRKLSPESIAKRSETVREKHAKGYHRPPRSQEAIEKQRRALVGRKQSPEFIEKRIAPLRGKKRTDEQKRHISEALKRRHYVHPPETLEKIAAARRGKPLSEETKAKISAAVKQTLQSKKGE